MTSSQSELGRSRADTISQATSGPSVKDRAPCGPNLSLQLSAQFLKKYATGVLFLLFVANLFEGWFFTGIQNWLVYESNFPFKLFPADALLLPLSFALASPLFLVPFPKPASGRGRLIVLWWFVCVVGLSIGVLLGNPNLPGDFRQFLIRSLSVIPFYLLGLRADLDSLGRKLIKLGSLLALVSIAFSIGAAYGLSLGGFSPSQKFFYVLIWPYNLLLMRILSGHSSFKRSWLPFLLMCLAFMATLGKPILATFLASNVFVFAIGLGPSWFRRVRSWKRVNILFLLLGLAFIVILVAFFAFGTGHALRVVQVAFLKLNEAPGERDLTGGRLMLWTLAVQKWADSPFWGQGFGELLLIKEMPDARMLQSVKQWDHILPHNIAVQLLMQTGLIGMFLLAVMAISWLWKVRTTRLCCTDFSARWFHGAAACTVVSILFYSLFGEGFNLAVTAYLFWACLGLEAASATRLEKQSAEERNQ